MAKVFEPPPHVMVTLTGRGAAKEARRTVGRVLAVAEHADWHDDAILVVSELVANALEASGECQMSLWYLRDAVSLRVEVSDASPDMPMPRSPSSTRVGGHGLRIVGRLSTRWGVNTGDGNKVVWFEIDG